jgi:hypothetical protein
MRVLSSVVSASAAVLIATGPGRAETAVNERARVLHEFGERAKLYVELHRKAASELQPLPEKARPEQIDSRRKALAQKIRESRAGARQGDVLTPDVVPVLLEVLRADLGGARGRAARETVKQGDPRAEPPQAPPGEPKPKPVVLAANAPYPDGAPLSSVPPDLLSKLPKLPEPLEYRFVGGHLILHDAEANLIVDFLKEVAA